MRLRFVTFRQWISNGWNINTSVTYVLIVLYILMRMAFYHEIESLRFIFVSLTAWAAIFNWSRLAYFMMPFATTGADSPSRERHCVHRTQDVYDSNTVAAVQCSSPTSGRCALACNAQSSGNVSYHSNCTVWLGVQQPLHRVALRSVVS